MIAQADLLDTVWLAGILEGEGCFDRQRGKYARIRLTMTDRDVVGRVATLFGSSIRLTLQRAPKSPTWHAEVQGARAEAIMRQILPFMGARRSAKIAEILSASLARQDASFSAVASGLALTRPPGLLSPAA